MKLFLLSLRTISTMMNATVAADPEPNLNCFTAFSDIKLDQDSPNNTVYCSSAEENFRAGESVELDPPVAIHNYGSHVGAILKVNQQSTPQSVLLSLFVNVTDDMQIVHQPPRFRDFVHYPTKLVVWAILGGGRRMCN